MATKAREYKRTDPKTGKKYKASSPKGKELFRKQQLAKKRKEGKATKKEKKGPNKTVVKKYVKKQRV